MKFNAAPSVIAIGLACLIAYAFHAFGSATKESGLHQATTLCALLFACITLLCTIGVEFGTGRTTTVVRAVAGTFFLLGSTMLVILALFSNSVPVLIIVMGILTLLFMLVSYAVSQSGQ